MASRSFAQGHSNHHFFKKDAKREIICLGALWFLVQLTHKSGIYWTNYFASTKCSFYIEGGDNYDSNNYIDNNTSPRPAKRQSPPRLAANPIYTILARCHFHITRMWKAVRKMPTVAMLMNRETTIFC
jgi:hypothetical protein